MTRGSLNYRWMANTLSRAGDCPQVPALGTAEGARLSNDACSTRPKPEFTTADRERHSRPRAISVRPGHRGDNIHCATSVSSVVDKSVQKTHHRDTEDTKVAQRRNPTVRACLFFTNLLNVTVL